MTTRREKSKPQKPQLNSQLAVKDAKPVMINTWMENLGKYLMDISKYVTTGVVISSLFKDVSDSSTIYFVGTIVAVSTLIVGLVLTNKKKKKEEWHYGNVSDFSGLWCTLHTFFVVLLNTKWQALASSEQHALSLICCYTTFKSEKLCNVL